MIEPYEGSERREVPRKKMGAEVEYLFHIDLAGESGKPSVDKGHSLNIGGGGLCMYTDEREPFEAGKEVYLTIKLPQRDKKIFALSKVVYITQIDQGPGRTFKVGFQFLTIDEEDKRAIMDFVSQ